MYDRRQITPLQIHCHEDGNFSSEASTCEFATGYFPEVIEVAEVGSFHRARLVRDEGELISVVYRTRDPRPSTLTIFNE